MNTDTDLTGSQVSKKPSVLLILIYFAGLGLFFGVYPIISIFLLTGQLRFPLGLVLIYIVIPAIAAWGVGQYKKWGRILGLIISWFLTLATGYGFFNFFGRVAGNFDLAAIITLFLYFGIFVASVLVIMFFSNHKLSVRSFFDLI